ncbi:MAG: hypothetical protein J6Y98_06285 [Bacteroidales bacterium]|nr:hypothetical protein [Bacteroidales bacterium]
MKKMRFFAIALATLMTLCVVSCKSDDDIEGLVKETLVNGGSPLYLHYKDANASYELRLNISLENNNIVVTGLTDTLNQTGYPTMPGMNTICGIVDDGKCGSLSAINEFPEDNEFLDAAGHFVVSVPAAKKHGYIIKVVGDGKLNAYQLPDIKDPETQYARLWLEEETSNGFNVKYEFPFTED